jgi:uncharacterized membrane protein
MSPTAVNFFSASEKEKIKEAIQEAELNTSGEIRVHIENKCKEDVLDRASFLFHKLEMDKTELRNGVLFYLAVKSHHFAILGDRGINEVVPEDFWENIKEMMADHFREGDFMEGLTKGITEAGLSLKEHFPYTSDDVNELPDDISFNA